MPGRTPRQNNRESKRNRPPRGEKFFDLFDSVGLDLRDEGLQQHENLEDPRPRCDPEKQYARPKARDRPSESKRLRQLNASPMSEREGDHAEKDECEGTGRDQT